MCYMTFLSTNSPEDLALGNGPLVQFSRDMPGLPEERYLEHAHKWFIASRFGCSCGFRHLTVASVELGFGEPEDWYPEEAEDIQATLQVMAAIRRLVNAGAQVDCVDAWAHGQIEAAELAGTLSVDLTVVGDAAFRFFENHRFVFSAPPNTWLEAGGPDRPRP
jgi:hypothetical protein